jgi:hypothetical protein
LLEFILATYRVIWTMVAAINVSQEEIGDPAGDEYVPLLEKA